KKEDATINTNEKEGQVDITVKLQEKGRQQISFTGGVSGVGGSYIGIDYSTNNLLGYGESLSIALSGGNYQKVASFSFTEPYLLWAPASSTSFSPRGPRSCGQSLRNVGGGLCGVFPFSQKRPRGGG